MISDNKALFEKVMSIGDAGNPVHFTWTAEILIGNTVIKAHALKEFARIADYVKNKFDVIHTTLMVTNTIYVGDIIPNKDSLQIRITRHGRAREGGILSGARSDSHTFDAFMLKKGSPSLAGGTEGGAMGEMGAFAEIRFQLLPRGLTEFRLVEQAGVFRNVTMTNLLKGLLTQPLQSLKGKSLPVTVAEGDNTRTFRQFVIPTGIKLIDLPTYIQIERGMYSSGIGYYLDNAGWWLYPLTDFNRFNKVKRTLTIVYVDNEEMVGNDTSYFHNGDNLVILVNNPSYTDSSEAALNNIGNGIRYVQQSNLLDQFRDHVEGEGIVPPGRNIRQSVAEKRPNGLNNFITPVTKFSDNPFLHMSNISPALCGKLSATWAFSRPDLLYPGMPVKYLYKDKGEVVSRTGTLTGHVSQTTSKQSSTTDNRYITGTTLTALLRREK